ncbi:MAG: MotA/TolQ/ExbB proton channel family protein [Elusimicrobia bacterium]|nr:MotA/TolQ/ExbB proton channel family protein [Elusimicrobiota bacterium]
MNIGVWVGFAVAAGLVIWGGAASGAAKTLAESHGILIVLGGTAGAMLVSAPLRRILSALRAFFALLFPGRETSLEDAASEIVRLARKSQAEGGILALRDEGRDTAKGFLNRAITAAIAAGEAAETRRIVELEIRQRRLSLQEDANFWRTLSVLSPMFGIIGTLLGMIQVLGTLSDPTKMAPSMALALSSALLGIGIANFVCVPVAGHIRLKAMAETLLAELLLEGVLDITAGKPAYLIELHLASYSERRRADVAVRRV